MSEESLDGKQRLLFAVVLTDPEHSSESQPELFREAAIEFLVRREERDRWAWQVGGYEAEPNEENDFLGLRGVSKVDLESTMKAFDFDFDDVPLWVLVNIYSWPFLFLAVANTMNEEEDKLTKRIVRRVLQKALSEDGPRRQLLERYNQGHFLEKPVSVSRVLETAKKIEESGVDSLSDYELGMFCNSSFALAELDKTSAGEDEGNA